MSNESRKIKPVSFNVRDEYENGLLQFVKSKNFSRYIKRLIEDDMKKLNSGQVHNAPNTTTVEDNHSYEEKEAMSSFF